MKTFGEKLREARVSLGMSQTDLGKEVGVVQRSIQAYENGEKTPRQATMAKLAKFLKVSVKYLTDEECEDPLAEIEKDNYIEEAHERYGARGARDVERLLADNAALFAGGELSEEQKDAFFQAVMAAYVKCKEEAKTKFSKKNP
ncbi:MAG: helix-turn-helix domain-containing protein [Acutalibacteraceae bacterium]|jgi:transcriptional regulator with XRE-family HTH domain